MPSVVVHAFFDLSATGGDFLTLNSTAGKGKLDNAAAILAGDIATDITADVPRLSIRRGRDSQLFGAIPAGTWQIQLDNHDRTYDPLYSLSPYAGNIVPGKRVRISANGVTIADGSIEDWGFEFGPTDSGTAFADCSDALAQLAAAEFDEWTATAGETAGPRITTILDRPEVAFTLNRDIGTGVSTLQADTVPWGTNVLAYANSVAASDLGWFFASRDGAITFRDRHSTLAVAADATFADDGTGLPFTGITVAYGAERLYNRVGIERAGGVQQTATDAASQATYRSRSLTQTGLLLDSDAQALDMATYLLGIYAEPELRISSLTCELAIMAEAEQNAVLSLDLTSLVQVTYTPNSVGSAISRTCIVEGITHDITPGSHVVTLTFGDTDRRSFMRLDDAVFGRLDYQALAF